MKRYRIEWQDTSKMWLVFDSQGRDDSFLGYYYGVSDAQHIADKLNACDDLLAYKRYVEANLERIERGGWTPVCFAEFITSEERETYGGEA